MRTVLFIGGWVLLISSFFREGEHELAALMCFIGVAIINEVRKNHYYL